MTTNLFPVQNFIAKPYNGSLLGVNVALLTNRGISTNDGQQVSTPHQSKALNCTIDFLTTYYKGQAATVNLQSQNTASPLDKITMIYVDNELNSQDVTISFPDTQQYIGVPAFTTGYYPVLTNMLIANVYNGRTGKVPVTAQSAVSIIFCNFVIPGFLSLETLSVTYDSSIGPTVPVIGDSTVVAVQYGGTNQIVPFIQMLTPLTLPQQYVITGIEINAQNLFIDNTGLYVLGILLGPNNPPPPYGPAQSLIRQVNVTMRAEFENSRFFNLLDETGLNIPCLGVALEFVQVLKSGFINVALPQWAVITTTLTYAQVTL